MLCLGFDSIHAFRFVHFQTVGLLDGIGGQSQPPNFLLLLADDIHGHEDIEGVIDSAANIFLIVLLIGGRGTSWIGQFIDY